MTDAIAIAEWIRPNMVSVPRDACLNTPRSRRRPPGARVFGGGEGPPLQTTGPRHWMRVLMLVSSEAMSAYTSLATA